MFCMKKVKDREPWGWEEYIEPGPFNPLPFLTTDLHD